MGDGENVRVRSHDYIYTPLPSTPSIPPPPPPTLSPKLSVYVR